MTAKTTICVCVTCKARDEPAEPKAARAGARLYAALAAEADARTKILGVECLSACQRSCTIAFSAPGKWTYVYGGFSPEAAPEILDAAKLFARAPDGIVPWRERPDALKKGAVARVPPFVPALERNL